MTITRRDFVNGVLVGTGTALLGARPAISSTAKGSGELGERWYGYGGVGDYAGSHGNTPEVVNTAHRVRDGSFAGIVADIPVEEAVAWAAKADTICADEELLYFDPYPSRQAWCRARCDAALAQLQQLPKDLPLILVNHFPLRVELTNYLRRPHFRIWCGTERTADWHTRFNVKTVVYGHLHIRSTRVIDGVRFTPTIGDRSAACALICVKSCLYRRRRHDDRTACPRKCSYLERIHGGFGVAVQSSSYRAHFADGRSA